MKTFLKIPEYIFKLYISLLVLFVISCGSRNASNSYRTTTVSYYADRFSSKPTSSGEIYRHSRLTASNKTLAFGTRVEIVNVKNEKSVIITVNDRGPLNPSREFDLSQAAFKKITTLNEGIAKVKYRILK